MTLKVGVVTASWGNPWREENVFASRLVGALAAEAEVELLLVGEAALEAESEARYATRGFPAVRIPPQRARSLEQLAFGDPWNAGFGTCSCLPRQLRTVARELPAPLQEELAAGQGGHSPALSEHLGRSDYDVVLFCGYRWPAASVWAVPEQTRVLVAPMARDEPWFWLEVHDALFERADRFLVITDGERRLLDDRCENGADRAHQVGFTLRVDPEAARAEPEEVPAAPFVVVPGDRTHDRVPALPFATAERLWRELGVVSCRIGPGASRFPGGDALRNRDVIIRSDLRRWLARAVAVLDLEPGRTVGRDVLEGMLLGTPAIVSSAPGATRQHAEEGQGGLWIRNEEELRAAVGRLVSQDGLRDTLGSQGREYADAMYGSPEGFVRRVAQAVVA